MTAVVDMELPPVAQIWHWLEEVPDPEIPVISLVDMGIIREVSYGPDEELVVAVTPTYSGCPATEIINRDIRSKLESKGVQRLRLERRLSPPWSTDWMSSKAREALRGWGIAPPPMKETAPAGGKSPIWLRNSDAPAAAAVACPHCGSVHTEKVSHFGSTPCKASYRCLDCLEPFEYFKCI